MLLAICLNHLVFLDRGHVCLLLFREPLFWEDAIAPRVTPLVPLAQRRK